MEMQAFMETMSEDKPPQVSAELQALWYDANGDWQQAHEIVQELHSKNAAWVHAYLHRKEGDLGNASYWYHKARRPAQTCGLQEEWQELVASFLKNE